MKIRWRFSLFGALVLLAAQFQPVLADGIIIPPPPPPCLDSPCPTLVPGSSGFPLQVKFHHVEVRIDAQVAETHVDQIFVNPTDDTIEGTYIFPLPADAAVSDFTLWVDGQPVRGEVLDAQEARDIYEDIVSEMRDPALLEYAGRGAVKASIFPIPPGGEQRVELAYSQVLAADNGLVKYVYPLNTEKFSSEPLESVSIKVNIASPQPIRAVYSPSHNIDVSRPDAHSASASYEASDLRPDTDFSLYYSIGEAEALHVLSFRDPSDPLDPNGYFLALLAPGLGGSESAGEVAKDVILVLDKSGSMEGEKIRQARSAAAYILRHLNPKDRFHVIAFSSDISTYAPGLMWAGEAGLAAPWIESVQAGGSTDINRALLDAAAAADKERPTYLIFLTDGLPTEGEQYTQAILDNFSRAARDNLRLFCFGVGYDVDTLLLDSLSREAHGRTTYVQEGQDLDEVLSGFYAGIQTPVLTDLSLDFLDLTAFDIYPDPLPDLFEGSQVVITGRYGRGGKTDIVLRGEVNGEAKEFVFKDVVLIADSREEEAPFDSLPRLWATRRIGSLLSQIRLFGPDKEILDHIVQLSLRYGIVTPYTSYLVTDEFALGEENREKAAAEVFDHLQAMPPEPSAGYDAVQKAAGEGAMTQAQVVPSAPAGGGEEQASSAIRYAGARTFVLQDGVWVDTAFDPGSMTPDRVTFLSPAYFNLVQSGLDMAAALALGPRVIVVSGGQAVEVVDGEEVSMEQSEKTPLPLVNTPAAAAAAPVKLATEAPLPTDTVSDERKAPDHAISPWLWLAGGVLVVFIGSLVIYKKT